PLGAAARRAAALAACRRLVGPQHRVARRHIGILEARPPVDELLRHFAALAAQREEVVRGAKAGMLEQPVRPGPGALLEARLQRPDLLDRRLEAARDGD